MIAAHFENLLFLLLIAVALLFQVLARAAGKANKKEREETPTQPLPKIPPQRRRIPPESDQERIRKLLEALGQPATTSPPMPVTSRTSIPPKPLAPIRPPPGPFSFPRARPAQEKMEEKRFVQQQIPPPPAPAPAAETHERALVQPLVDIKISRESLVTDARLKPDVTQPAMDVIALLRSAAGLRYAIIVREILGRPRGLQTPDLV